MITITPHNEDTALCIKAKSAIEIFNMWRWMSSVDKEVYTECSIDLGEGGKVMDVRGVDDISDIIMQAVQIEYGLNRHRSFTLAYENEDGSVGVTTAKHLFHLYEFYISLHYKRDYLEVRSHSDGSVLVSGREFVETFFSDTCIPRHEMKVQPEPKSMNVQVDVMAELEKVRSLSKDSVNSSEIDTIITVLKYTLGK